MEAEIARQRKTRRVADGNLAERDSSLPWYRRVVRWGLTISTERDPVRYDIAWWRDYWKRTAIQGVIIPAGGIVAFYPSKFPLHHQAEFLNGRDLYGELAQAAHEDGLAVMARVDSGRAAEAFFRVHPNWFARTQSGEPYRLMDRYLACVNSPYFDEYIPGILKEIIERTRPEGFAGAAWRGPLRDQICYCENCARKFRNKTGEEIPKRKDWSDAVYREWIQWNYERRTELWDLNNRVTKEAGGPHCLWIGGTGVFGSIMSHSYWPCDMRELAKRSEFFLLDRGVRAKDTGFQEIGNTAKLIHQLVGWNKVIVQTVSLNQNLGGSAETVSKAATLLSQHVADLRAPAPERSIPAFGSSYPLAAKPEPEARMTMIEAIAGGVGPKWFINGAYHDDRRFYDTPERIFQWHRQHEEYLKDRRPLAAVGVVWSQRNNDYYGRDDAAELVEAPYRGFMQALIRGRIPYLPVHASDIDQQAQDLAVLILTNVGALSDAECEAIRQFARRGGAVIASGATSLYDEWGDPRPNFALADLFGAHAPSGDFGRKPPQRIQSYLRLTPEMRGKAWGPKLPDDPMSGERHPVLRGFDETDIIPFGGALDNMRIETRVIVPLTYVPPPVSPEPEGSWLREPKTDIPGLVLNSNGNARIAYLPADIDRRYAQTNLPDHGNLLINIVRWAAGDRLGFDLQGPGLIDCHVYRQPQRMIVHLVNLTNQGTCPLDELVPLGPLRLRVKLPQDVRGQNIACLVSGATSSTIAVHENWMSLEVPSIVDHEVLVIS